MARAKTTEPSRARPKSATIEELTRGAKELQEFLAQVEDLGREGFPYLDAARARTELQFRECIRRTFGEKSPEFQAHRDHKLSPQETRQSLALIKSLIGVAEQKKIELQGGPAPQHISAQSPSPPTPVPPQMTVVPASTSTAQTTMTQTGSITPSPVAVATTVNPGPPPAPVPPAPSAIPQTTGSLGVSPSPPAPSSVPPNGSTPVMPYIPPQPVDRASSEPQPLPPQAAQPTQAELSQAATPLQPPRPEPEPHVPPIPSAGPQPTRQDMPLVSPHLPSPSTTPDGSSSHQEAAPQSPQSVSDSVDLVKVVCCRFHSVARQLRLRGEYRTTLNVEDEVDAQDLLHALLRIQFDNIGTDEWTPSYSGGALRTTLLLNDSRLAVIVKKTRPGLSVKDLTDQIRVDAARYRFHGRCTILLCFIYDPDGRIGNPQGLEASLTSMNDSFVIDVLVAPK